MNNTTLILENEKGRVAFGINKKDFYKLGENEVFSKMLLLGLRDGFLKNVLKEKTPMEIKGEKYEREFKKYEKL